ncbi:MAG: Fic family protein [Oligoflexia bacterium]|nr:Fic family protein [Oligoflexia bacterium]
MIEFKPHIYTINSNVVNLIAEISALQGELRTSIRAVRDDYKIYTLANVDAVHYSTKIEGNKLTRDQVTKALEGSKKKIAVNHDIQEVINYSKARNFVFEQTRQKIDIDFILSVHAQLLDKIVKGKLKGHFREAQNVIKDSSSGNIVYLPPEASDVLPLMKGLLRYVQKSQIEKISPLVLAPIFHYEFVSIHPFMDGNGRLARIITNAIIAIGGYDVHKYAALEKQHEKERAQYYHSLRSLQSQNYYDIPYSQNITTWIIYWLNCLKETYKEAISRVSPLSKSIVSKEIIHNDRLTRAVSLFKRHLTIKAADYAIMMGLERTQAVADLNILLKKKIIEKIGGGRSTIYKIKNGSI